MAEEASSEKQYCSFPNGIKAKAQREKYLNEFNFYT
jgi:hypothetical protein